MSDPTLKRVQCLSPVGLHHMAYWEWAGPSPDAPVLVCVHGLSRQGRDFDALARAMCERYRVVCPDVVGRGHSDWLPNPALYQIPSYVADMVTLIARLGTDQVHWVGTSMGGLIGLGLAAQKRSPITRLVLNDVGPTIEFASLQRIGQYLGKGPTFATLEEGADYLKRVSVGFGPHSKEAWLELSKPMFRQAGERLRLHYDPSIAIPMTGITQEMATAGEAALWAAWDAVEAPTLVLRGADSDLLSRATAEAMGHRGPCAQLAEFAGVGHAPTLQAADQIAAVRAFLFSA
ncbi:alpha/beta hydrolase [Pelomonas sp. SE-A7]|uniref:alpha/beta fold hydrolase n=1 Tax=Pelomonas sp. SE-A7 TaxID=3054953 RepID=UPI00259CDC8B|nr:alpha/beta hydrolase [Pelomonas sp. SE-A7]MDM4765779.1 alpha/beta hydrolase [Pelomonas sp. SE-A7]